jgi:cellobiose phosphorylase
VVASQGILGVQPDHSGLRIDPCIPPAWPGFRVHRRFRGADYEIEVRNPDGVSTGVCSLTVDGSAVTGGVVPVAREGATVRVEVVLGR